MVKLSAHVLRFTIFSCCLLLLFSFSNIYFLYVFLWEGVCRTFPSLLHKKMNHICLKWVLLWDKGHNLLYREGTLFFLEIQFLKLGDHERMIYTAMVEWFNAALGFEHKKRNAFAVCSRTNFKKNYIKKLKTLKLR